MISKNNHFDSDLERIERDAVRILNLLILRATDSKGLIDGLEEIRDLLDCLLQINLAPEWRKSWKPIPKTRFLSPR